MLAPVKKTRSKAWPAQRLLQGLVFLISHEIDQRPEALGISHPNWFLPRLDVRRKTRPKELRECGKSVVGLNSNIYSKAGISWLLKVSFVLSLVQVGVEWRTR